MKNALRSVLLVVPAACCATLLLAAQEPTEAWKQMNVVGDRIEGFGFDRPVGQGSVSLVAFFAHHDQLDFNHVSRLSVEFFAWQPGHVKIVARETMPQHNYYMEFRTKARAGANQWSNWTTESLRDPNKGVSSDKLGVVVRLGADSTETDRADGSLAPAILRQAGSAALQSISEYSAVFLPDADLSGLSYEVFEGCGAGIRGNSIADNKYFTLYEGNPLTITFQAGRPGLTTLRVRYEVKGKDHPALTYCFWHVPDPRNPVQPSVINP